MIKVWDYLREYELLRDDILNAVDDVFKNGTLIFGPKLDEFETKFSSYHDSKYGIGVGNCTDAITIALKALDIGPGDEVVMADTNWIATASPIVHLGAKPIFVDILPDSWCIDPDKVEAAITPKTKWLILNSPNNPTGSAYTREELAALGAVLERHPHVWIMTDDMYEHLVYDGFEFTTIAQVTPSLYERTLTMNGVSKAYAMTGWRLGVTTGPPALISKMGLLLQPKAILLSRLHQHSKL